MMVITMIISYIFMLIGIVVVAAYVLHKVFGLSSQDSRNYSLVGVGLLLVAFGLHVKNQQDKWLARTETWC